MTNRSFNMEMIHHSWRNCIEQGLEVLKPDYLKELNHSKTWLPGPDKIFNAFSLPLEEVRYVLVGESPYPRASSANGYAFWDAAVNNLWSPDGLSKPVNRATSLRNLIKMLLVAEKLLNPSHTGQTEIAQLDKHALVQTNSELFQNFIHHGFLLLNASLVLQEGSKNKDAVAWHGFLQPVLTCLQNQRHRVKFILFGSIASKFEQFLKTHPGIETLIAEHPYNHTFIKNKKVIDFFAPLHLLRLKNNSK